MSRFDAFSLLPPTFKRPRRALTLAIRQLGDTVQDTKRTAVHLGECGLSDRSLDETSAMVLEGRESWFRLSIVQYQFPQIKEDEWDSNWLIIDGHVCIEGKEWRFTDPCLTTFEAMRLADWLDAQAKGNSEKAFCAFTEPNLEFERLSDSVIRVGFSHESSPPWAMQKYGEPEYGFDVLVGPGLSIAGERLRLQLTRFPVRGGKWV